MATTQGFELVAEVRQDFLLQVMQAAWDSGVIPHSTDIMPGLAFGPYQVANGVVDIPRAGLALNMVPAQNAVQLVLPSHIQVQIANPPVPSASMFDMDATVTATLPVGKLPGTINVGLIVDGLPRGNVGVTLTSGDPIGPITLSLIQEYVDNLYRNGTIPHSVSNPGVSFGIYTADAYTDVYDDPTDSVHRIDVTQPAPNQVAVSIPIHLKLTNLHSSVGPQPLSPMGVETRVDITAQLAIVAGSITAKISTGTIAVEDLTQATGVEGSNYMINKAGAQAFSIDLDALLKSQIQSQAQAFLTEIGDIQIFVPTQSQIETFIGDQVYQALLAHGDIGVWTPQTGDNPDVSISDVAPQALSDALAIGINPSGSANPGGLTNFIPAGREFALAIDGAKVIAVVWEQINKPQSDGGLGGVPTTLHNVDGHDVKLNSLTPTLQEGSIHFEGNVTIPNAIAGHIDVDADFHADAGMTWVDNADGSQAINSVDLGSGVSLGLAAWILSLLLGFIGGGLIGGIVAIVVMEVASSLASNIGGAIIRDDITKQVKGVGAWPQDLEGIGTVTAKFQNPIDIHADCVIFSG